MNKFILLRPDSGLNDILYAIERYAAYADQTDRILIVDTAYKYSRHFNAELGDYLVSRSSRIILNAAGYYPFFDKMSVFPGFLENRVNDYEFAWHGVKAKYCLSGTDQPIDFDLKKNYTEKLLVAHKAEGGDASFFACSRLRINADLKNELKLKLQIIGGPYHAIHVRHTDYQTNYQAKLLELKRAGIKKLFVATDNAEVVEDFKRELGADCVYSFAELKRPSGSPLHFNQVPDQSTNHRNRDAILDLLLLALAEELYILPVKRHDGHVGVDFSGFSLLARNLWTSKIMLKRFLS